MKLFDASAIESGTNALSCFVHLFEFIVSEVNFEGAHDTISANHTRNGQSHVLDAIFAFENCGAGQDGVFIIENGLDEAASSHSDTGVREALLVDNIVSNLNQFLFNSFVAEFFRAVEIFIQIIDGETSAASRGPSNESSVAVFTENITVDVLRVNLVLVSQDATETIGFEHRTGTEDEVARIIELRGNNISSNVKRVGDHDDHSFLRALNDFAHNGAHDLSIGASQLQAVRSFTRADGRACRDNDDVCIFAVFIVTEVELDVRAVDAARCMAGVLSFAPSLVFVEVDEDYFRSKLEVSDFVGNCGANVAGADDDDFSSVVQFVITP